MRHPAPRHGRETTPHFAAAREGRLEIPRCEACEEFVWPPTASCPQCRGPLAWAACRGAGTIASFSVVHRPADRAMAADAPYAVAIVRLAEGVRLFTNIVDCDPAELRCGLAVTCRFEPTEDPSLWVPVFAPAEAGSGELR